MPSLKLSFSKISRPKRNNYHGRKHAQRTKRKSFPPTLLLLRKRNQRKKPKLAYNIKSYPN